MGLQSSVDLPQLEADIITYHKKRQAAYKIMTKGYPKNYQEIADKYINPKTGQPLTRQYIMLVKRRLVEQGKIKEIKENLGV